MKTPPHISPQQKEWLLLVFLMILTIGVLFTSVISLSLGWNTIFQNILYFPIIFACVYYVKRGFVFSVLLAFGYFVLMLAFSSDPVVLQGALMRVLLFIIVVWSGKFIARNKYGLNMPFLLKGSPVFEENHLKNRVFVLREEMYGGK
jgi:hypothetical protein